MQWDAQAGTFWPHKAHQISSLGTHVFKSLILNQQKHWKALSSLLQTFRATVVIILYKYCINSWLSTRFESKLFLVNLHNVSRVFLYTFTFCLRSLTPLFLFTIRTSPLHLYILVCHNSCATALEPHLQWIHKLERGLSLQLLLQPGCLWPQMALVPCLLSCSTVLAKLHLFSHSQYRPFHFNFLLMYLKIKSPYIFKDILLWD